MQISKSIRYHIDAQPCDVPIRGNASACGDDFEDLKAERWIIRELEDGNQWAWCDVTVTASIDGIDLYGTDHLGCCSYLSGDDFLADGYYADMREVAKADLMAQIQAIKAVEVEV